MMVQKHHVIKVSMERNTLRTDDKKGSSLVMKKTVSLHGKYYFRPKKFCYFFRDVAAAMGRDVIVVTPPIGSTAPALSGKSLAHYYRWRFSEHFLVVQPVL
jgi:hypothetical protein